MNEMYLATDENSKYLLVTDGERWFQFDVGSNGCIGDVDFYAQNDAGEELTDEELSETIRNGIKTGKIYSADDFIYEYGEADDCGNEGSDNRYPIPDWEGMTIEEVDTHLNYNEDFDSGVVYPRGYAITVLTKI